MWRRKGTRRSWQEPQGEFSFFWEGQGALEWVRPERRARALETVMVLAVSVDLLLVLESLGETV